MKLATRTRAIQVEKRLQELFQMTKRNFIETGRLIVEAEDSELWRLLTNPQGEPYTSFDNWISTALHYGRTTALAARDVIREFHGIPSETLQEITRANLKRLMMLPPKERKTTRWLRDAATLPEKQLVQKIHIVHPEIAPVASQVVRMSFNFTPMQAEKAHRVMSLMCDDKTSDITKEDCIEQVFDLILGETRRRAA